MSRAAAALTALLLTAAAYELALALGWIDIGDVSGAGAPGEGWVTVAALATMLIGMLRARAGAVCVAAAAFTVARLYTYDPYYAPTLRRMSDGGLVAPGWGWGLLVAALAVAVAERRFRVGAVAAAVLLLCAGTVILEGTGH